MYPSSHVTISLTDAVEATAVCKSKYGFCFNKEKIGLKNTYS